MSDFQVSHIPYIQRHCELKLGLSLGLMGGGGSQRAMTLGLNLAGPASWNSGQPFANIMYITDRWKRFSGSGSWTQDRGTLTATVGTDQFYRHLYEGSNSGAEYWVNGTYTVRNPAGAKIALGSLAAPTGFQTWTTSTSFTVTINNPASGVFLFVEGSLSQSGGNLAIILPNHVSSYDSGNIWNSAFLSYIQAMNLKTIRFMDWGQTSGSIETDWADRADPTAIAPYSHRNGMTNGVGATVPYEWMFDLCSRVNAHPWICIPGRATNAWASSFATLAAANLPAGKRLRLEYGNEIWNTGTAWASNNNWCTRYYHTRKTGTHIGSGQFTITGHGYSENDALRAWWTKDNYLASIDETGSGDDWRVAYGSSDVFVHVIDANTISLKATSGGVALNLKAGIVSIIFCKATEAGKTANNNTNYSTRSMELWDIIDPVVGVGNIVHICGSQAASSAVTSGRLAVGSMATRADVVAIAPYFSCYYFMGKIVTGSGIFTPYMFSNESSSKIYVGVYATGSTPSIDNIINGTGTGYVGKCASTSYTKNGNWDTGGGGLTNISVVNGTTYDVHYVWERVNGDRFRNSTTITATASVTNTYLADAPRNFRMRVEEDHKASVATYAASHAAVASGRPLICYETGLDFTVYTTSGQTAVSSEAQSLLTGALWFEDAEAGTAIKTCMGILANAGFTETCYFGDVKSGVFFLSNTYADTTDAKYVAYSSLGGRVTVGTSLSIGKQVAVNGQSSPGAYPTTLVTFADSSLTYYIYSGDTYGSYDISANLFRIANSNGSPWATETPRFVKVYATNGKDSTTFTVNANSGGVNYLFGQFESANAPTLGLSLRKLRYSATNAIRVRRSSDNTESDIGFVAGVLDTTSLLSFCGAGSGYVVTWYDQSGGGRDLTMATQATQPRIVNAGVLETKNSKPAIKFLGAQRLEGPISDGMMGAGLFTLSIVASIDTFAAIQAYNGSDNSGANRAWQLRTTITNGYPEIIAFDDVGNTFFATHTTSPGTGTLHILTALRGSSSVTLRRNGATETKTTATTGTPSPDGGIVTIGSRYQANNFMTGHISEYIIAPESLSTTDRALVETSQGSYYGITVV